MTTSAKVEVLAVSGYRAAIEPLTPDEMTEGGIYKPDMAREQPTRGRVVGLGPSCLVLVNDPAGQESELKVGDVVVYAKYAGVEVEINGTTVVLLKEEDILGRITVSE